MKKLLIVVMSLLFIATAGISYASSQLFKDVSPSFWAYSAIQDLAQKGIIHGNSDGNFRPNDYVTRAQLSVILDNMIKQNQSEQQDIYNTIANVFPSVVELFNGSITGSGFAISDSEIVTNYHVIKGETTVMIKTSDGYGADGTVIKTDETNDLALVKVNSTSMHFKPLIFADNVKVGEQVLAIGSPFGNVDSVSMGIISKLNAYHGKLQTDASINKGSSGGCLVNLQGKVVGMPEESVVNSDNVAYAIPYDVIEGFLNK